MPNTHLVVERARAGFLRVLLARPRRRNAVDLAMAHALHDALRSDWDMPVVLASANPDAFCAGADLNLPEAEQAAVSDLFYQCCEAMVTRPGPVIAVMTGPAVGGGAQLAAAADMRIAGQAARLRWTGPPDRELGVGAWILPSLVTRGTAHELAMTGRWVGAAEALAIGLVNQIADHPLGAAEELAAGLAARGAGTMARIKTVTAAGGLLDRLRAEREANRAAWGQAPTQGSVTGPADGRGRLHA
jgi:enoyl-CoA hydratase/carnithine racemase